MPLLSGPRPARTRRVVVRRDRAVPLYQQVAAVLRTDIRSGALRGDGPLPSESQLRERFGVSRVTVRLALRDLRRDGLVIAKQGKGTFVRTGAIEHELGEFHTLTEVLAEHGYPRRTELVSLEETRPPRQIAADLGLAGDERAVMVKRRHFAGQTPIALTVMYLPSALAAAWRAEELEAKSVYELAADHRLGRVEGTRAITAGAALAEVAATLGLGVGEPVLIVRSRSRLPDGAPFESSVLYFHPRHYTFVLAFARGDGVVSAQHDL